VDKNESSDFGVADLAVVLRTVKGQKDAQTVAHFTTLSTGQQKILLPWIAIVLR
jgi:hypothetical protein